jgi:tetratricopeptide (TPR) repeat protein
MYRPRGSKSKRPDKSIAEAFDLAHRQLTTGQIERAQDGFRWILQVAPNHAGALHFLGLAYFQKGNVREAIPLVQRSIAILPNDSAQHYNLAYMLTQADRWEEAADSARRSIELDPSFLNAKSLLVEVLQHLERHEEAVVILEELVKIQPQKWPLWSALGRSRAELWRFDAAVEASRRVVAIRPDLAGEWSNLGIALEYALKLSPAREAFQKALELDGNNAMYRVNYGLFLADSGDPEGAIGQFDQAIELQPDHVEAHFNRSQQNLLMGNYAEGWKEFEWRWKMKEAEPHGLDGVPWDGSNPRGKKLLVCSEQGFGDMFQFVRYVPLLTRLGAYVILLCQQEVGRLMTSLEGGGHIVVRGGSIPPYDAYAPLMSLPGLFRTDVESIPNKVPYLMPPREESDLWAKRLASDKNFRVGFVWSTESSTGMRWRKLIPAQDVLDLLNLPGVTFYGLHAKAKPQDLAILGPRIQDLSKQLDNFSTTAAVIKQMDLVVTIDTAAAHLAGAMGLPVWILLPWSADWRWCRNRADSPWYPTARLFRQTEPGDWKTLLSSVKEELTAAAHLRRR